MQSHEIAIKSMEEYSQHVLNNPKPVIVDFWAEWCGPCMQLKPTMEKAAQAQGCKWVLVTVNCDEAASELSDLLQVSSIPHVCLFKNGQVVMQFVGNNQQQLHHMIDMAQA